MNDENRPDRLLTSPLALTAAGLLIASVAVALVVEGPTWFDLQGRGLYRTDLDEVGLSVRDGTMPSFAAPFVGIYPGATTFSAWFLALAGWPSRLWSRLAMAVVLVGTAALIVLQAQEEAPGPETSTSGAYLAIGTGLVLAAALAGIAASMFNRSRWARCLSGAGIIVLLVVGTVIGLVQLLAEADGLSLTVAPLGHVASLLIAALSLLVLAAATRPFDRVAADGSDDDHPQLI